MRARVYGKTMGKFAPKQCLFGLYQVFSLKKYIYIGGKKKAQIWGPKQFSK